VRNKTIRWLLLAGAGVLGVAAVVYVLQPAPLEVETSRMECGPMRTTVASEGRTRVRDRFVVSAPVEGQLGRVEVKEGRSVKRGDTLAWLTPSPLDVRSEQQREAALQVAEAERQGAEAEVSRARVDLEHATRELRRVAGLVEQGIRPRQELDAAQTAEAAARQVLNSATFQSSAAAIHVGEIRSTLLKGERHAVPIKSPIDGVVLRIVQQSERIVASGTPIVEIGDPGRLELVFEVLSTDAVRIQPGAGVLVQNWGGEQTFNARVRLTEPGAFTKVSALGVEEQRVNVIADFTDARPELGDAYRIEGEIIVWESDNITQVPVSALFRNGDRWNVFVVENNRANVRGVEIGHRNQKTAEVVRGLNEGDVVVLYPDDRLVAGGLVKILRRE